MRNKGSKSAEARVSRKHKSCPRFSQLCHSPPTAAVQLLPPLLVASPRSSSPRYPWQGAALRLAGGILFPFCSCILILKGMWELGEPGAASLS